MASLTVEFKAAANAHVGAACVFYTEREDDRLAARFLLAVDRAIQHIVDFPLSCPEFAYGTRRKLLDGFPYWLYYRPSKDRIDVLAVLHAKRNPRLHRERSQ
jgi:plasmid stabilization system protein ParE